MIYHADMIKDALLAYSKRNPNDKLNILVSFGNRDNDASDLIFDYRHLIGNIICDSGTWTLNNAPDKHRETITVDGYAAYLKALASNFDFYFNFDEDFSKTGFEKNLVNQKILEDSGFKPVPVIHDCYSDEEVDHYIDEGYDLIAIGSGELKNSSVDELRRIVERFHSKGIRVHFLGCTEYEKLANTPVFSCDSSSWGQKGTRGYILYWNHEKPGINKTDSIDFVHKCYGRPFYKDYEYRFQLEEYLDEELDLSFEDMLGKKGLTNRYIATIHYFVQLEKRIKARHKELGF